MLFGPETHADNAPSTWQVVKHGRRWALTTKSGHTLETFDTKKAAIAAKTSGFHFTLYNDETRWFAGESVRNWIPYKDRAADIAKARN